MIRTLALALICVLGAACGGGEVPEAKSPETPATPEAPVEPEAPAPEEATEAPAESETPEG
jgi:hypothetical protein